LGSARKRKLQVVYLEFLLNLFNLLNFLLLNRNCVANSKLALQEYQNAPRPGIPNSLDFENHMSWDFAEAVQIPFSSQQEVKLN
jgi:hypothetical protein